MIHLETAPQDLGMELEATGALESLEVALYSMVQTITLAPQAMLLSMVAELGHSGYILKLNQEVIEQSLQIQETGAGLLQSSQVIIFA